MNSQVKDLNNGEDTDATERKTTPAATRSNGRIGQGQDKQSQNPKKEISFELKADTAKEVLLAGDFTGWEKKPIKLRRGEQGAWSTRVQLTPGLYHYRFVVDGQWRNDPRAHNTSPNPYGSTDSVLEIS